MGDFDIKPWHTWGTSQTLNMQGQTSVQPPVPTSNQLLKIDHDRPESWRFMVAGEILQSAVAAGGGGINLAFDLIIGLGRSNIRLPNWIVMGFPIVGAPSDLIQTWAAQATMPPLTPAVPDTSPGRLSDVIVAQNINLSARVTFFAASNISVVLKVDAYFAPNVHVHAPWFGEGQAPQMGMAAPVQWGESEHEEHLLVPHRRARRGR